MYLKYKNKSIPVRKLCTLNSIELDAVQNFKDKN